MLEWFLEKIDWILENKEWIFSGIGIPIIVIIFKFSKKNFRKEKNINNIPIAIKRQKINISSKDLEKWENLHNFFYIRFIRKNN